MYNTDNSSGDPRRLVQGFLLPDEDILWVGKPYTTLKYRPNPFLLMFGLFWLGFAVFWTVTASVAGGFFGLFGLPFICIGVALNYNNIVGGKKRFKKTVYALTSTRVMIITETRRGISCIDYRLVNISGVQLMNVRGQSGTVMFVVPMTYYGSEGTGTVTVNGRSTVNSMERHSFIAIDDVNRVYRMIEDAISASH